MKARSKQAKREPLEWHLNIMNNAVHKRVAYLRVNQRELRNTYGVADLENVYICPS